MDKHRAEVIAAAEAVRLWARTRRAAWTAEPFQIRPLMNPALALHPAGGAPWPSVPEPEFLSPPAGYDTATAEPDFFGAASAAAEESFESAPAYPAAPGVTIGERWSQVIEAVRPLGAFAGPALRWTWRVALVTGVAAAGVWGARAYKARPPAEKVAKVEKAVPAAAPAPKPVRVDTASKRTGRLQVDSDPPGAHVLVDGKERGLAPLAIDGLPVGSHAVTIRGEKGTVERTVAITASRTTQVNEAIYSGWLHISSPIELQITDNDRGVRLDDRNQALLSAGEHVLTLSNKALGFTETRNVNVTPGGTASISIEPPPAMLTVTSSEPAQVSIDGEMVGEAPLTDHPTRIGTRDVQVRSASGATRFSTITLTMSGARLEIDFSKP